MPITISEHDRGRALSTIILAFALDPVIRCIYPDAVEYLTHWPRFAEAYGGAAITSGAGQASDDYAGVTHGPCRQRYVVRDSSTACHRGNPAAARPAPARRGSA